MVKLLTDGGEMNDFAVKWIWLLPMNARLVLAEIKEHPQ